MKKKVKYIFFDFDGTISDAKRLTFDALITVLDRMDFKFSRIKAKKAMGGRMPEILGALGINEELVEDIRKGFYHEVVKRANLKDLKLCCDVGPLWELKKKGYRLVVVSNGRGVLLDASIKALKLEGLFFGAHGAEEFDTKDKFLRYLAKKYEIDGHKAMYIGDRFSDIVYAHRAKFVSVAIHNKCAWSSKKEILAENPDYIIHDFEDLKELVKKLG